VKDYEPEGLEFQRSGVERELGNGVWKWPEKILGNGRR
jgi:hypothetical protein